MPRYLLACFASLFVLTQTVQAQEKRPITFEDLWKVQRVGKPSMSPDGAKVVTELATFDLEADNSTSQLWLLASDGSMQRQLTHFKAKNSGPIFSPDGKQIAFISKRSSDVPQIQVIALDGGEAKQISNLPMAPSGLKWANDGKSIFCVVNTWPGVVDDDAFRKREKEAKENKVQAFVIDEALFRIWDTWIADGKRPVVFRVDLATGKHVNLFAKTELFLPPVSADASSYDVSPDGKTLAFTAETTKQLGTDFNGDIYEMPLDQAGAPKNLTTENTVGDFSPAYSPDGTKIAFLRQTTKFFYADRVRLMIHDRATGANEEWTKSLDRSVLSLCWSPQSDGLVLDVEDKGYHRIYGVAGPNKIVELTKDHSDTAPSMARSAKAFAFLRSTFDMPGQVWVHSPDKGPIRVDRFNDDLTKQWDLGATKEMYFKGADDDDVQMWVVYPPKFDAAKKWPLIQFVHGGPHNGIVTDFHYRWNFHLLASKGYVVSCVNFHGSSGFGQKFTDSITGDMATKPFFDVMKGTDLMEKEPFIDKDRMVAVGASYGGYMMAWLNGHTDRFRAMVCHAGVYNWHSMMASDIVRSRERPLGAMPWGDLNQIDKQSPQRFAAHFKTPTLVTHGEKDYRVPVTQGFEYYNTLRLKGVPTRLIYFPDENHWILKSQNGRLWTREVFTWLAKYAPPGAR